MTRVPTDPLDRILSRSDWSGDCWLWLGGCYGSGYGQITDRRSGVPVKLTIHRYVYERFVEPIPEGLTLDHLCETKRCFNPDHLEVVTRGVNTQRGVHLNRRLERRRKQVECVNGHPYTEENTYRRPNGNRDCRTCTRDRQSRRRQA